MVYEVDKIGNIIRILKIGWTFKFLKNLMIAHFPSDDSVL